MNKKRRTQLAVALFSLSAGAQFLLMTAPGAPTVVQNKKLETARQESHEWSSRDRPRHRFDTTRDVTRMRPAPRDR